MRSRNLEQSKGLLSSGEGQTQAMWQIIFGTNLEQSRGLLSEGEGQTKELAVEILAQAAARSRRGWENWWSQCPNYS